MRGDWRGWWGGGGGPWPFRVPAGQRGGAGGGNQALKPLALTSHRQGLMGGLQTGTPNSGSSGCPGSPIRFFGKCISYSVCNVGPSLWGCEPGEVGWGGPPMPGVGGREWGGRDQLHNCIETSPPKRAGARAERVPSETARQRVGGRFGRGVWGGPTAGRAPSRASRCLDLAPSPGQG